MMYQSVQRDPTFRDMAGHCCNRSRPHRAQTVWALALCCLGDVSCSCNAASIPNAAPAGLCRKPSSTVRARSLESWLPQATWLGFPKDMTPSHHSHHCEQHDSPSLIQTKRARTTQVIQNNTLPLSLLQQKVVDTVHKVPHAATPSKQRQVEPSSRAKHAANLTHPPGIAKHPLLLAGSGMAAKQQHSKAKSATRSTLSLPASVMLVIKTLCICSSVLGQMSPIPQVRQFHKLKDTGEADSAPYVSIMFGGLQWSFYGIFTFIVTRNVDVMILVYSNMAGAILGFYYVHGFFANCKDPRSCQRLRTYCKVTAALAAFQLLMAVSLDTHHALLFCGLISSISGTMGACSLLTTMPQVIQSRCSSSINMPLLCTGMFGNSCWLIFGIMVNDVWVIAPGCVSLLFQSCAATLVVIFPRTPGEPLLTSKTKSTEQKATVKDTPATKTQTQVEEDLCATSGEAPDYGTMQQKPGGTGSTF